MLDCLCCKKKKSDGHFGEPSLNASSKAIRRSSVADYYNYNASCYSNQSVNSQSAGKTEDQWVPVGTVGERLAHRYNLKASDMSINLHLDDLATNGNTPSTYPPTETEQRLCNLKGNPVPCPTLTSELIKHLKLANTSETPSPDCSPLETPQRNGHPNLSNQSSETLSNNSTDLAFVRSVINRPRLESVSSSSHQGNPYNINSGPIQTSGNTPPNEGTYPDSPPPAYEDVV